MSVFALSGQTGGIPAQVVSLTGETGGKLVSIRDIPDSGESRNDEQEVHLICNATAQALLLMRYTFGIMRRSHSL